MDQSSEVTYSSLVSDSEEPAAENKPHKFAPKKYNTLMRVQVSNYVLSLPIGTSFTVYELIASTQFSVSTVQRVLPELARQGHLKISRNATSTKTRGVKFSYTRIKTISGANTDISQTNYYPPDQKTVLIKQALDSLESYFWYSRPEPPVEYDKTPFIAGKIWNNIVMKIWKCSRIARQASIPSSLDSRTLVHSPRSRY